MTEFSFAVPTLFGLEGIAAQELRHLGLQAVKGETGRVTCRGTLADIPRMNLNLRTGERVLVELGRFPAPDFEALFQGTAALPLERYIPKDGKFPVKGYALSSALHAVPACQAVIKKAAARRLGRAYGLELLPETGALFQLQFALLHDMAVLYLDTSGPGLYKRGYRARGVEAPIRETLAAALVSIARYRGRGALLDPFCGSGTIAIEGALMARNRAPGLGRSFSAERWPLVPPALWKAARQEAQDKEYHGDYTILAGDVDEKAVALARENAALAGVAGDIRFSVGDAGALDPKSLPAEGRIITNPPYGQRLLDQEAARRVLERFGGVYRHMPGWELYLISSDEGCEKALGRRADKRRKLYNGMLRCQLFQYDRWG